MFFFSLSTFDRSPTADLRFQQTLPLPLDYNIAFPVRQTCHRLDKRQKFPICIYIHL